ncbi:helix-turn-helix transcriptional regulator [Streptomyces sp. NPDC041068]|uniref:helix-turn-helix domain-containing protein n=1 Tax=Streptomyces sp. NPDC041068 TaxID=3155130 RepID=UPI003406E4CD
MYDPKKARARRERLNLSVAQFAARAGVSERAVYAYEAGDRTPSVDVFTRMATALRVPFRSLLKQTRNDAEFAELYGAEMTRRKHPAAEVISTHEDAANTLLVDRIRAVRKESGRG